MVNAEWRHGLSPTHPSSRVKTNQIASTDHPTVSAVTGARAGILIKNSGHSGVYCDILPTLKGGASRGSDVTPVDSDGWECKVRGPSATGAATKPILVPVRASSYLFVLRRSAWSAHCFGFGSRHGKHRVNCQFSTHVPCGTARGGVPSPWRVSRRVGRCIPALKGEVLAPYTAVEKPCINEIHYQWFR